MDDGTLEVVWHSFGADLYGSVVLVECLGEVTAFQRSFAAGCLVHGGGARVIDVYAQERLGCG